MEPKGNTNYPSNLPASTTSHTPSSAYLRNVSPRTYTHHIGSKPAAKNSYLSNQSSQSSHSSALQAKKLSSQISNAGGVGIHHNKHVSAQNLN